MTYGDPPGFYGQILPSGPMFFDLGQSEPLRTDDCRCPACLAKDLPYFDAKAAPLAPDAPRIIVAFTGLAGSGKSTAALHLVNERGFARVRFAGPLKAMMAALGLAPSEIEGDRKELPCDLLGGKSPRYAMQTLGTEWGRYTIGRDLWVNAWRAAVDKLPAGVPVVVDDCRFPNEAEAVRAAGGILVRINRPCAGIASTHESEAHALDTTATLENSTTLRILFDQVDAFIAGRMAV